MKSRSIGFVGVGRLLTVVALAYALLIQGFMGSSMALSISGPAAQAICMASGDGAPSAPDTGHKDCTCPSLCAQAFAFVAPDSPGFAPLSPAGFIRVQAEAGARQHDQRRHDGLYARGPPHGSSLSL